MAPKKNDLAPINFRIPRALHTAIKVEAATAGKSIQAMMVEAIIYRINRRRRERGEAPIEV